MAKTATRYRVLCWGACTPDSPCGINYPSSKTATEVRADTGDIVDDIPAAFVSALVEAGLIEAVGEEAAPAAEGGAK